MSNPKVKKIQPFFRGKTPKVRLIIYLLGTGEFSMERLQKLTVEEFKALELSNRIPSSLDLTDACNEIIIGRDGASKAFCNTSGRPYSVNNYIDMLKRAHQTAEVPYKGWQAFIDAVT